MKGKRVRVKKKSSNLKRINDKKQTVFEGFGLVLVI
jgi:hypothetical protein